MQVGPPEQYESEAYYGVPSREPAWPRQRDEPQGWDVPVQEQAELREQGERQE